MIQVKTLAVAWCNFVTWILYFVNMCEYTNMKSIEDGVILNKINVFKTISMELFMDNIFYRTDVCVFVWMCVWFDDIYSILRSSGIGTLRPKRNRQHFADDIFKRIFFSMKMFEFRLKFHLSLLLKVQLTIFQHWFRSWLGAVQATSHYLNRWWLDYRRIYASLGM